MFAPSWDSPQTDCDGTFASIIDEFHDRWGTKWVEHGFNGYPSGNENISHLGKFGKSSTQICRKSRGCVNSLGSIQCDFDMIRSLPDNSFDHEIDSSDFPDHTKRTRLVRGDSGETR